MKTLTQAIRFMQQYEPGGRNANHCKVAFLKRFEDEGSETDIVIAALNLDNADNLAKLYGSFQDVRNRLDDLIAFMRLYNLPFADMLFGFFTRVDWNRVETEFDLLKGMNEDGSKTNVKVIDSTGVDI